MTDASPSRREILILSTLVLAAFVLFRANNDFPSRYHGEEPGIVEAVQKGRHDAQRPALMPALVSAACRLTGTTEAEPVVRIGRTCTALFGAGLVFFAWCFARETRGAAPPLWTAAGVALSPVVAVHAHYMEENVFMACFAMATLATLLRWMRASTWRNALLVGLATGLAAASHYRGALLILLWIPALLLRRAPWRDAARDAALALGAALLVFGAVNHAMLADGTLSVATLWRSPAPISDDLALPIPLRSTLLTFHLRHSLWPGLTPPVTIAGLTGLAVMLVRRRATDAAARLTFCHVVLFYLAAELSGLKAFPDFMRDVIPLAPPLLWLGFELIYRHVPQGPSRAPAWLSFLLLVPPGIDSFRLVQNLNRDTRADAEAWVIAHADHAVYERFAAPGLYEVPSLLDFRPEREPNRQVRYLVASSFTYAPYFFAESMPGMADSVYRRAAGYHKLFAPAPNRSCETIQPAYRSFAFSNPKILIIYIRGGRVVPPYP